MRSSPSSSSIALTNAWNDAFVGAIPILPFHFGSVRSKTESGTSSSVSASVLYAITRERPDVPTQWPSGSRKRAGTRSSAACGSSASSPSRSTAPSEPGSCAKNTSAGELSPSSAIVAASSALSP